MFRKRHFIISFNNSQSFRLNCIRHSKLLFITLFSSNYKKKFIILTRLSLQQWHDYSRQVWDPKKGEVLHYLYYKYFFDFLSDPTKKIIPHLYNIFNPRVLEQARENGDLRIPEKVPESKASTATPRKRAQDVENSGTKKQRTSISTTVLDSNVVELEDSDEDDIQILEQRLLAEGGRRRVYYKPRSEPAEEITLQSRYLGNPPLIVLHSRFTTIPITFFNKNFGDILVFYDRRLIYFNCGEVTCGFFQQRSEGEIDPIYLLK